MMVYKKRKSITYPDSAGWSIEIPNTNLVIPVGDSEANTDLLIEELNQQAELIANLTTLLAQRVSRIQGLEAELVLAHNERDEAKLEIARHDELVNDTARKYRLVETQSNARTVVVQNALPVIDSFIARLEADLAEAQELIRQTEAISLVKLIAERDNLKALLAEAPGYEPMITAGSDEATAPEAVQLLESHASVSEDSEDGETTNDES